MRHLLKLAIILFTLESCATLNREVGSGIEQSQTTELPSVKGISYDLSDDLVVKQGDQNEITLIGDSNILDNIDLKIKDGILYVDLISGNYVNINMKAEITLRSLDLIENSGSGDIFVQSRTHTNDNLTLMLDGSGNIHVRPQLDLEEISVHIDSHGDINFKGDTTVSKVEISTDGSGELNAYPLTTSSCRVSTDGSGDAYITVTEDLSGTIKGTGNIYYKGNPKTKVLSEDSGGLISTN